ncbi:hypothetical protein D3C84_180070 [compost metagenome]
MEFLKKMFSWLLISGKTEPSGNHPDLHPLDLDELKQELNVEFEARRLGEVGLPRPEETRLSGPENKIVQRLEAARRDYMNWATIRLKNIQIKMHACDITKTVNRALQAAEEFERTANGHLSDYEAEIRRLQAAALQMEEDLRLFKLDNRLVRTAKVASPTQKLTFVFLAIFIVVLEGALNANFFAQSLDGGLIQGFTYAFLLAFCNVAVAMALGRFGVPHVNHIRPLNRMIGYSALIVAPVIMVVMGLVIAHFRDSLAQGLDDPASNPGVVALQTLMNNPFQLHDIYSWLLFGLSIFFALASLAEGYYWEDPYPGFSRVQKNADNAVQEYEEGLAEMRELLEKLKDEHLDVLESSMDTARAAVLEYKEQIHEKTSSRHRLQRALHKAENVLEALIAIFRTDNELHRKRKGVPIPAYFSSKVALQEIEWPSFETAQDEQSLALQEELLSRLMDKVEPIRAQIQSSFDSRFDQLKSIREQIR